MFRVVTISREYASGGGNIARKIADQLGWTLLDKAFVEQIARAAQVDPELARRYDERIGSWLHRISRNAFRHGSFEAVGPYAALDLFDAETMAALGRDLILEAACKGDCVIVGRGAQCVLQGRKDVFHLFIYAPWPERLARVRERFPEEANPEERIRSMDQQRAAFIRTYYGCDWIDPHLYHMLLNSELGEQQVTHIVLEAIRGRTCTMLNNT